MKLGIHEKGSEYQAPAMTAIELSAEKRICIAGSAQSFDSEYNYSIFSDGEEEQQ